jgi:hypothetical protein
MIEERVVWNPWKPFFWLGLGGLAVVPTLELWIWLGGRGLPPAATLGAFAVGEFTLIFLISLILVLAGCLLLSLCTDD